jgi:hypothetical protein
MRDEEGASTPHHNSGLALGVPGFAIGHGFAGSFGEINVPRPREVEGWVSAGSHD